MEEDIIKGARGLTIRLLARKVGNLSPELLARVSSLNLERLEALTEALLDFKQVGDLEQWLAGFNQPLKPKFRTSTFATHTSHEDSTV